MNSEIKLSVVVPFHYNDSRLSYLCECLESITSISCEIYITVVTNKNSELTRSLIQKYIKKEAQIEVVTPTYMGHPYFLTWAHVPIFFEHRQHSSFTHFLYIEDDIRFSNANFHYWIKNRELLKPHGLIPGFLRFEVDADGIRYASDVTKSVNFYLSPKVICDGGQTFISLPQFYQAMFLLDIEGMDEYLQVLNKPRDLGRGGIRENAAKGIALTNVPPSFHSRLAIEYFTNSFSFSEGALIHHMPNNFLFAKTSKFGKTKLSEVVTCSRSRVYKLLSKYPLALRLARWFRRRTYKVRKTT